MAKKVTKKTTKKTTPRKKAATKKPVAAKAKTKSATTKVAKVAEPVETNGVRQKPVTLEQIRARAFEIYKTGQNPSDPVADWYQAERELANV